jgi:predicted nuclease of predicted toxin-antitoxin system
VPKYLLDANLSPKVGRYLSVQFGLDVLSLLTMGLGEVPDHEVLRLARSAGRIVITMDRDFVQPFSTAGRIEQGIIYLDLPNSRRYVPDIQQRLGAFFKTRQRRLIWSTPWSSCTRTGWRSTAHDPAVPRPA